MVSTVEFECDPLALNVCASNQNKTKRAAEMCAEENQTPPPTFFLLFIFYDIFFLLRSVCFFYLLFAKIVLSPRRGNGRFGLGFVYFSSTASYGSKEHLSVDGRSFARFAFGCWSFPRLLFTVKPRNGLRDPACCYTAISSIPLSQSHPHTLAGT